MSQYSSRSLFSPSSLTLILLRVASIFCLILHAVRADDIVTIDDTNTDIVYSGSWSQYENKNPAYQKTLKMTREVGASAVYAFQGTAISVYGALGPPGGSWQFNSTYSVDGGLPSQYTYAYSAPSTVQPLFNVLYFALDMLDDGPHTIVVTNYGQYFWLDYFDVDLSSNRTPLQSSSSSTLSSTSSSPPAHTSHPSPNTSGTSTLSQTASSPGTLPAPSLQTSATSSASPSSQFTSTANPSSQISPSLSDPRSGTFSSSSSASSLPPSSSSTAAVAASTTQSSLASIATTQSPSGSVAPPNAARVNSSHHSLSSVGIIGVIIGSVLLITAGCGYWLYKRQSQLRLRKTAAVSSHVEQGLLAYDSTNAVSSVGNNPPIEPGTASSTSFSDGIHPGRTSLSNLTMVPSLPATIRRKDSFATPSDTITAHEDSHASQSTSWPSSQSREVERVGSLEAATEPRRSLDGGVRIAGGSLAAARENRSGDESHIDTLPPAYEEY